MKRNIADLGLPKDNQHDYFCTPHNRTYILQHNFKNVSDNPINFRKNTLYRTVSLNHEKQATKNNNFALRT